MGFKSRFKGSVINSDVLRISFFLLFVFEKSKIFPAEYYSAPEKVTIDGVEGKKVTYTFDLEDGTFDGALYVAAKDSTAATIIIFETFAGSNEQYKAKLLYYDHCYAVEQYIINREGEIEEEESSGEQKQNYNFNQPLSFSSLDKKIKDVCGKPPQPPDFYR